jgi:hypothetical protein
MQLLLRRIQCDGNITGTGIASAHQYRRVGLHLLLDQMSHVTGALQQAPNKRNAARMECMQGCGKP